MHIKQKVEEEVPWMTSTIQVVTKGPEAKALAKYQICTPNFQREIHEDLTLKLVFNTNIICSRQHLFSRLA